MKRFLVAALLALALFAPSSGSPVPAYAGPTQVAVRDCPVYVTRTGHKYHRAGCRYLRTGAVAIQRSAAVARGLTPCKVCGGSDCER